MMIRSSGVVDCMQSHQNQVKIELPLNIDMNIALIPIMRITFSAFNRARAHIVIGMSLFDVRSLDMYSHRFRFINAG